MVHSRISTPHPGPLPLNSSFHTTLIRLRHLLPLPRAKESVRGGEGEKARALPQDFAAPIAHVERRVEFGFTDTPAVRLRQYGFRAHARSSDEVFPDWHKIGLEIGMQIGAALLCPNGAMSLSPGLRGTSYPGKPSQQFNNPEGVAATSTRTVDATPLGLGKMMKHVTQGSLADSATLG